VGEWKQAKQADAKKRSEVDAFGSRGFVVSAPLSMSYQELDSPSPRASGGPRRTPTTTLSVGLDDNAVGEYLLTKQFYLAALELHQELLEGNNGIHNVGVLNKFFGEQDNYAGIVRQTSEKIKRNQNNCRWQRHPPPPLQCRPSFVLCLSPFEALGGAMGSIESPFSPTGLQPAIAERDQRIAVLEYQLRCAAADIEARDRASAPSVSAERLPSSAAGWVTPWLGSDEDGQPITPHERRTLNALVRRYLLARGYKATSASFTEEAGAPAASTVSGPSVAALAEAEFDLIALPRAQGSQAGGPGRAVLSLLGMHRKRIAPIQQLAESEARNDSVISALKLEVSALQEQLDLASAELATAKDRVAQVSTQCRYRAVCGGLFLRFLLRFTVCCSWSKSLHCLELRVGVQPTAMSPALRLQHRLSLRLRPVPWCFPLSSHLDSRKRQCLRLQQQAA
jgi:hypothetical protein